jgi:hypothetical protein
LNPASETEFQAVQAALLAVCHRAVDPDAIATKLGAIYEGATLQSQVALLELFGALGGGVAVEAVHRAIMDPADEIQDAATRILGTWPDTGAASVLLAVMESDAYEGFRIRALRGFIRIIRQMDISNDHRFNMTMEALSHAHRDAEILLIVDALGRIPIHASLMKLLEFLDQPAFAEQASLSAVNIGRALIASHPNDVGTVMRNVLEVADDANTRRIAEEILEML